MRSEKCELYRSHPDTRLPPIKTAAVISLCNQDNQEAAQNAWTIRKERRAWTSWTQSRGWEDWKSEGMRVGIQKQSKDTGGSKLAVAPSFGRAALPRETGSTEGSHTVTAEARDRGQGEADRRPHQRTKATDLSRDRGKSEES